MIELLPVIPSLVIIFAAWMLICNSRTHSQRRKISRWVFKQPDWGKQLAIYNSVDYDSHMWALFLFRDPKLLYKEWKPKT